MIGKSPDLLLRLGTRTWRFAPGDVVLVGRGEDCDVLVEDPRISRRHLRISYLDGWVLRDVGSTCGSWLDGRKVIRRRVSGDEAVRLGDPVDGDVLELRLDPPAVAAGATGRVTIGRAVGNDIVLDDVRMSRHHARLDRTARGWRLTDLGSRNGVLVNAVPIIGPTEVRDGDRLAFGGTDLVVDGDDLRPVTRDDADLIARGTWFSLPDGRPLLSGLDLRVRAGEFVAVVGPSGAGKSTLLKVLTGRLRPTAGSVTYNGYDVHDNPAAVLDRIGFVPQDDVVHRKLTPRQALTYSAMLRLPPDVSGAERNAVVAATLAELGMTEHADKRIDKLSGGQRKRVSVALELLTSPSLLLLDEPTSGLDPALDRQLLTTLRGIANAGRIVLMVTHNVANLGLCDTALVLAPGGVPVYVGPPALLAERFGTDDWADVFTAIADASVRAQPGEPAEPRRRPQAAPPEPVRRPTWARQTVVLARRHARLIVADHGYAVFLLALPLVLGALALAVPGDAGLRNANPIEAVEAGQILVLAFVGAAFMGGAAGAREVVGEQDIVVRERAAGVLPRSYACAKAVVFAVVCAVQATLLVTVLVAVKPGPTSGVLADPVVEVGAALWATATASCLLALVGSACVRSAEQAMPVLVVTIMAQLVLCGGMVPVTGRPVLSQVSWFVPSRWGYAAGAATVDLTARSADLPHDVLWAHTAAAWLSALLALAATTAVSLALLSTRVSRIQTR